eukprot:360633-Chlamydomonas_euryale.AAC.6
MQHECLEGCQLLFWTFKCVANTLMEPGRLRGCQVILDLEVSSAFRAWTWVSVLYHQQHGCTVTGAGVPWTVIRPATGQLRHR